MSILGFRGPETSVDTFWTLSLEQQDAYRRGQLLANVLFGVFIFASLGALAFFYQAAKAANPQSASAYTASAVAGFGVTAGAFVLAWLNRRGHVEIASALTSLLYMAATIGALYSADSQIGGYGWIDQMGWALMALGVLFAATMMRASFAALVLLVYAVTLIVYASVVPIAPGTLEIATISGLVEKTVPLQEQFNTLKQVLLLRPILVAFSMYVVGALTYSSVLAKLRLGDASERRAIEERVAREANEVELRARTEEQRWIIEVLRILIQAVNQRGDIIMLPAMPLRFQQNPQLVTTYQMMGHVAMRIPRSLEAQRALARLQEHVVFITRRFEQQRSTLQQSGMLDPFTEETSATEALLSLFDLPAGVTDPQLAGLISALRYFISLIVTEERASRQQILTAITAFTHGQYEARIPQQEYFRSLSDVARAINWLLDGIRSWGARRATEPFINPFADSHE